MPADTPTENSDSAFLFSGKELSTEAAIQDARARLVFASQMRPRLRRSARDARVVLAATILRLNAARETEKRTAEHGDSGEYATCFEHAAMKEASRRYVQALTELLLDDD